jgi:NAD(P)-dependent dehydrogenase (short-subunit alcohol dehydrogenase family)
MTSARLDGQVALVTGGGEGIGRAVALTLASRGARVVVMGPDERALGEAVGEMAYGGGKARHAVGDARARADVERAVDKAIGAFGRLDAVIACVPGNADARASAGKADALAARHAFAAGAARMAPDMGGRGRLLAIAALDAHDVGPVGGEPRRSAIEDLVRASAAELAPRGITCNALDAAPLAALESDAAAAIADAVSFLCSPGADHVTGQALSTRGGAAGVDG